MGYSPGTELAISLIPPTAVSAWVRCLRFMDIAFLKIADTLRSGKLLSIAVSQLVPIPVTAPESGASTALKMTVPSTAEENICKKNDVKAQSLLLMALPNEHQLTFNQSVNTARPFSTAKAFNTVRPSFEPYYAGKRTCGLQKRVSRLVILGVVTPPEDLNVKFFRSLPSEWDTHVSMKFNQTLLSWHSTDSEYQMIKSVLNLFAKLYEAIDVKQYDEFTCLQNSKYIRGEIICLRDSNVMPITRCDKESDNTKENTDDSLKQQQKTNSSLVKSTLKYSCPKHMVPRAVLMKTGLKTVNNARLVNTIRSANTARPFSTARIKKPLVQDGDAADVDEHLYRSMIGSLMYLTASRPDIMFAVCACARFQVSPKTSHLLVVKRIFRYLKGKPSLGLWYSKESPLELVAYTDSDYAGATQDRKSTTGGC
ncbi:hypothetical protein Tco_1525944 [Tanacetum coccineum]